MAGSEYFHQNVKGEEINPKSITLQLQGPQAKALTEGTFEEFEGPAEHDLMLDLQLYDTAGFNVKEILESKQEYD